MHALNLFVLSHQGYFEFLQTSDLVGFLSQSEIDYIKSTLQGPSQSTGAPELTYYEGGQDAEGSSDTYWPLQSDTAAPGLDLGWPLLQHSFIGPTEVTTLVNPSDAEMPSIKEQAKRLIKNARHVSKNTRVQERQMLQCADLICSWVGLCQGRVYLFQSCPISMHPISQLLFLKKRKTG